MGLSVAVFSSGCKEEARWKSRVYQERQASSSTGEVRMPRELWKWMIEPDRPLKGLIDISATPPPHEDGADSAIVKKTVETDLKPVALYLIEETRGVLGGQNHKITFGPGGGELDLRDFISEERGAFRAVFEFGSEVLDADPKAPWRVWYLANGKRRKVGPDWVGAGCNKYMDITSAVRNANQRDGLLLAVAGDRYLSTLAGTFFFTLKNGARVEVSRVTIFDSSKRNLQCNSK